jgi:hypothetical protein
MMETIKFNTERVLLERAENGVILYDLDSEGNVKTKVVYEIHYKDGIIDFSKMAYMFFEIAEFLKYSLEDPEANQKLEMYIEKIDKDKPSYGEKDEEKEESDDE